MTTDCEPIRTAFLEAVDARRRVPTDVIDHVRDCPSCAAFAHRHQELDARLAAWLTPPTLTPLFRARLRRQVQRDIIDEWREWLPDVMHFIACVMIISLYVMLAPGDAHVAIVRGVIGTVVAYAAITIATTWLDDSYN